MAVCRMYKHTHTYARKTHMCEQHTNTYDLAVVMTDITHTRARVRARCASVSVRIFATSSLARAGVLTHVSLSRCLQHNFSVPLARQKCIIYAMHTVASENDVCVIGMCVAVACRELFARGRVRGRLVIQC